MWRLISLFTLLHIVNVHCAPQETSTISTELLDSVFGVNSSNPQTVFNLNPTRKVANKANTVQDDNTDEVGEDPICVMNDGKPGLCVPYYQCTEANTINENGESLIDIRINDENQCGHYLNMCCGTGNITRELSTLSPPRPVTEESDYNCGHRNRDGVGFRISGEKDNEAQFAEFPWMVAIVREGPEAVNGNILNVYLCGGSLIHPKVVLTAAHCVASYARSETMNLKIRAGEWDTQTTQEIVPHQDRYVDKVIVHDKFYSGGLFNDVALLILRTPVDNAPNVGVVCLPPPDSEPLNVRCLVSGWGKDVYGAKGKYQVILKRVELPMVGKSQCQKKLRTTRLGRQFQLHDSFVCAGGEKGRDVCKGDGGSPLVCPMPDNPELYMQTGIVSWGIGCGDDIPAAYSNVAFVREWIDEQLSKNQIDLASSFARL